MTTTTALSTEQQAQSETVAAPLDIMDMDLVPKVVTVDVVTITPEVATEMLGRNTHNRTVKPHHMKMLSRAMTAGQFVPNGDTIRVGRDGTVLDGQHRLLAVVDSGVTVEAIVVTGLPNKVQETIDTHAKRTVADVLSLRGERNSTTLGAVLRLLWRMDRKGFPRVAAGEVSNQELLATLDAHPSIHESVLVGRRLRRAFVRIPAASIAVAHQLFVSIDPEDCDDFFEKLESGAELSDTSPIYRLREQTLKLAAARAVTRSEVYLAMTIKAWNAYRQGREVQALYWRMGGHAPEAWPVPV